MDGKRPKLTVHCDCLKIGADANPYYWRTGEFYVPSQRQCREISSSFPAEEEEKEAPPFRARARSQRQSCPVTELQYERLKTRGLPALVPLTCPLSSANLLAARARLSEPQLAA